MFSNSPRRQQQASRVGKRGNGMADSTGTSPTPSGISGGGGGGSGGVASTGQGGTKSSVTAGLYPPSEFPYSSVALSPSRRYAILAGKDVLQVVRLMDVAAGNQNDLATSATQRNQNRDIAAKDGRTLEGQRQDKTDHAKNQSEGDRGRSLDLVRSLKVTQYLVSPASGTGRGDATAGGGVSSSGAVGGTSGGGSRRYGDVRDAFNLMATVGGGGGIGGDVKNTSAAVAAAAAAGGGSSVGAGAIKVSRVAWSNHFKPTSSQAASSSLHNQVTAGGEEVGGFHMEDTAVDHETTPRNSRHGRNIDTLDPRSAATIDETTDEQSFIAAAGSNGVVAIWDAQSLLFSSAPSASSSSRNVGRRHESSTSGTAPTAGSMMTQPPEGILSQHTRAVNALAWHPRRPGLLLTGSQDSTIKLWERRTAASPTTPQQTMQESTDDDNESSRRLPWFMKGGRGSSTASSKADNLQDTQPKYSEWWCRATFEPKSDAILDVQWSKHQDDTFGVVTGSGNLIVYSMFLTAKALVKIAAHTKEVTTLDWHPINPFLVATGGQDRCVKVWDLESFLNMDKQQGDHTSITINSNTWGTTQSANSTNSSETEKSPPLSGAQQAAAYASGRNTSSGLSGGGGGRAKSSRISKHVLSISASVTQVRWRPASNALLSVVDEMDDDEELLDRHEYHLAVATKESSSAGGSGVISLWSIGRPFMALSVMEGHREGAVSDFVWLQSPILIPEMKSTVSSNSLTACDASYMRSYAMGNISDGLPQQDTILSGSYVWQHCLSVGGDGKCLIQSFVRGERPIRRVPSSCFALTNLSPFQQGFGSLQCFSVYQNVPNQEKDDFSLTALRQDEYTAQATGAFYEPDTTVKIVSREKDGCSGRRVPLNPPKMIFSVVDQGDLDQNGLPALRDQDESLCVAPEVVHVSRFTRLYKMYPDESCPTPIEICSHNGRAAAELDQIALSFMWKTMENLLRGCGLVSGGLPSAQHVHSLPANAMQCAIFPTVKAVLYERADAGDVQTCVVLCEVLEVIEDGGKATKLPGLSIGIVREWYMSYIDILHQMCLFTAATFLIKNCSDPLIGALNQQSTT
mmetsp:Transcript_28216/g.68653  ORF Transcript_28216/g.68653 Transcript_28216/m.68653 type:complete len:1083 (-) Transcript_28216:1910-5158(-)